MTKTKYHQQAHFDIAVIGGGLSGLIAAWAAANSGHSTVQIAPAFTEPDGRTTALLADSIAYLKEIGLWDEAHEIAFPLKTMRIIDATDRLIRAPQVDFKSVEVDLDAFGYNIENKRFAEILTRKLAQLANYHRIEQPLLELRTGTDDSNQLLIDQHDAVDANIVLAADGKNSVVRHSLGIGERQWQYPQVALVGNFTHTLPHNDISTEFHTKTGPFTLVPLGENRSSLVCVVDPAKAEQLKAESPETLGAHFETKMDSILGKVRLENSLKSFPLSGMIAKRFGKGAALLVGEAAHVFPPIGAQGLNLGLRDVREALKLAENALAKGSTTSVGDAYHRARSSDVNMRTASVDLLNRSLLSDLLPVQMVRSAGLYTFGALSPLRRLMMREGVAPGLSIRSATSGLRDRLKSGPLPRFRSNRST